MPREDSVDIGIEHRPIADLSDVHVLSVDIDLDDDRLGISINRHIPRKEIEIGYVVVQSNAGL